MSEKLNINKQRTKEIQERTKERNLILQEIKNHGSSTVEELSKTTGMEKMKLMQHLIAMKQFGKIVVIGERDRQLVYGLPEEN